MPALVPGIHVFVATKKQNVDGRDKPGHDDHRGLYETIYTAHSFNPSSPHLLRASTSFPLRLKRRRRWPGQAPAMTIIADSMKQFIRHAHQPVMPALVAGIHVFVAARKQDLDGRDKPAHHDHRGLYQTIY